jgi:uncharacterized GH25 family protein
MNIRSFFSAVRARLAVLAMLVVCTAPAAWAHDVVLVPEAGTLRVRYGHPQDWQPVSIDKLIDLQLLGSGDSARDAYATLSRRGIELVADKAKLAAGSGPWLAASRYDNGLWVELPPAKAGGEPQYRNASRASVPEASSVMVSLKYAKAYAGSKSDDTVFKRSAGHALEIIPLNNPLARAPGNALAVRVLLNGQPLPGAGVEVGNMVNKLPEDKIVRHTTDADGVARVPLRARGVHMLGVDLQRPNDGTALAATKSLPADKLMMIATYTFVR